jgi:hypothetical protein
VSGEQRTSCKLNSAKHSYGSERPNVKEKLII